MHENVIKNCILLGCRESFITWFYHETEPQDSQDGPDSVYPRHDSYHGNILSREITLNVVFDLFKFVTFFLILYEWPEASLIVPDFPISVYGSSCNYLFLASYFLLFFIYRLLDVPTARCYDNNWKEEANVWEWGQKEKITWLPSKQKNSYKLDC